MNIETVFTASKIVRAKFWQFLTKSYLIKIFKSRATNWYTVSQNEASLHKNVPFELKNHFFKDTISLLFKDAKQKLTASTFLETILLTTQKNLSPHTRTYIFVQWIILQDKMLPVQSH